ncbi:hypothetical protein FOMPIDRAFT_1015268 [Fomitopsis schrenkii]|uniref:Uncharacterized protein n=1 Tax=Fomitopsis schrenkii TaxID=2126942 RepID=S8EBX5_FOMSC|nr:hypothetical protein FOMPIDRAFT_1015268 [Fomitopsis schrenkii]
MLPILLFLGSALALIGVLHELPPTSNVELFHGTSLMTPDVMEAFLVYLPTRVDVRSISPAVEGTAAVVGGIIDGASAAVTIRNSAVQAPPGLIWLSETSRSDIGFYGRRADARGARSSDYFYNLDFVLFDALDGVDVAKGTGALLAMDAPFFVLDEAPDVDNTVDNTVTDATVNITRFEDVDGDCDNDDGGTTDYTLFFLCGAIWIYSLWGIIPFISKLAYKLPFVKSLVDDFCNDLKNTPYLLFQLAYVGAGTFLLEEVVLGVFFADPLARIGWLMERARIDGKFLAQEFAVLYLWVWWKAVVPAERARARLDMGLESVAALEERVVRDGMHHEKSSLEGSMTRRVLELLDGLDVDEARVHRPVCVDDGLDDGSPALLTHEAMIWLDDWG